MTVNAIPQKWALPAALNQNYTNATTSSIPGIRAKLAPFSDAAKEMGIPNTLIKIAKGVAQYFVTLESSAPAKDFVANCNTFGDAVKVFSFAKGVDDILLNVDKKNETGLNLHKRNLGIASGFFQLIISGMAGVKLLNTFQVLSIAQISEALGTTAVLPFAVVGNGVEIVKNVIDITNGSIRVHQTNEKRAKKTKNCKNFNLKSTTGTQKIGDFLTKHVAEMEAKQLAAEATLTALKDTAATTHAKAEKAADKYQKISDQIEALDRPDANKVHKFIKESMLGIKLWRREAALFEAKVAHDQVVEDHSKVSAKLTGRITKLDAWTKAKNHFDTVLDKDANDPTKILLARDANDDADMTDPLNQLIEDKGIKWKAQRNNFKMDNWKDGLGIAISVVATIGLIAATVLIFTGVGTIPVLLTMTSLWLLISLAGLGSALLKKYHKPVAVPATNFAKYNFAAA